MNYRIIDKYFSKKDNLFYIIKEKKYSFEKKIETYDLFDEFYHALNENLNGANLLDYNFKGINLNQYNFYKAKIPSSVMIKMGMYNETIYKEILQCSKIIDNTSFNSYSLKPSRQIAKLICDEEDFVLCYISDLHLNQKIIKKYKNHINQYELEFYLEQIVEQLKASLPCTTRNYNIVFIGDISSSFKIFKLFFKIFRKKMPFQKTFVVLGNHELWDTKLNKICKSIDEIVEKYRKFLLSLNCSIFLLYNDVYLPNDKQHIYSQEEILKIDTKILREKFLHNGYAIFGGIGYAGKNKEFNYKQGIYRSDYITQEVEQKLSNITDILHKKITEIAKDKKIFFITHMPKTDWSVDDYNNNWFYLWGHTHKNFYCERKKIYADNQIGYKKKYFKFKYLSISKEFDIFKDYTDGIYEITEEQYKNFYYGIGARIEFNRKFNKLFMIKRNGTYCFLVKINQRDDLKFLNGGKIQNVENYNLNYFYENLTNYSNSIKLYLQEFNEYQNKISKQIKKMGGNGKIHGCIIDIDFYTHLFINPLDGKITPYFARSINDKYVYNSLENLLKDRKSVV